jgi:2-phospho-L-lactate transferase/gluconeogenesis factor (CofD/UPF0052 family)
MTQQHPITPPPELIQKWSEQFEAGRSLYAMFEDIYRAGADAELEACCEWLVSEGWFKYEHEAVEDLRAARRPKPPSLKEQALQALAEADLGSTEAEWSQRFDTIRRALEQLPNHTSEEL